MKHRDTAIDFAVFVFCGIAGAVFTVLLIGNEGHLLLPVSIVSAILGTGIFRILLPYSSLPRNERMKRDMLCDKINAGAFANDPKKKRYFKRTIRLYHNGRFRRALIRLDNLRDCGTSDADKFAISFWTGMCCYYMKLYSDAIGELTECYSLKQDTTAASNLGLVFLKIYDYENAERYFRAALNSDSTNVQAIHGLSVTLAHCERYAEALELCQRGLGIDSGFYKFFEVMSLCYAASGDEEQSYKFQKRLAEHNAQDGKRLLNTLDSLFEENK